MIIGEVQNNNEVIISMIKTWKRLFDRAHYHAVDGSYWWTIRQKAQSGGVKGWLALHNYHKYNDNHGSYISIDATFAGRPTLPHGIYGVFISSRATIGKDCTIFQQVTIGSNQLKDSKGNGSPVIGDNVYIGCGAKIIGNVTIGDNVRIGANCIVTEDIPDNCTVVLNKPRVIQK